ncbi:MAG: hypothetical protein Q9216_003811 [Gyalolechia sp. 2 TL-2023]
MSTGLKVKSNGFHEAECFTPCPKRQRITRTSASGKSINYDMRYHPMDDVLRPAASAARKAAHGLDTRRSSTASDSTTFVGDAKGSDNTEDNANLRPSPKTRAPITESSATPPRRRIPPRTGSPSSRRVTRAEVNGEKPVLYDMRHHPMDIVTRPAAARRVHEKYSSFPKSTLSATIPRVARPPKTVEEKLGHLKASKKLSISPSAPDVAQGLDATTSSQWSAMPTEISKITPAKSFAPNEDMIKKSATSLWRSLSHRERLMYLLQKGAPADSSTLPLSWHDETQALQAILGIDGRSSDVGFDGQVARVQAQYVDLHHRLQESFGAGPEPSGMKNCRLHYAEDFDVYDCEVGEKYSKRRGDDVVHPPCPRACDWIICEPKLSLRSRMEEAAITCFNSKLSSANNNDCEEDGYNDGRDKGQEMNANKRDDPLSQEGLRGGQEEGETGSKMMGSEDGHRLGGSYNDTEGYLRQSRGGYDEDLLVENSAEDELIASMQISVPGVVEDTLGVSELAPMFPSSSSASEDEDSKPVVRRLALNRRSRNRAAGSNFSVYEDEPGNTPRIKRQIAMNPISPGTDIPKENMVEHDSSDELAS